MLEFLILYQWRCIVSGFQNSFLEDALRKSSVLPAYEQVFPATLISAEESPIYLFFGRVLGKPFTALFFQRNKFDIVLPA